MRDQEKKKNSPIADHSRVTKAVDIPVQTSRVPLRSTAECKYRGKLLSLRMNLEHLFILRESNFPRYLHSAVLLSGTLLVFGGNTHNDTSLSNGAKCFSADFLAYDIACDEWRLLPKPDLHRDVNRFGHSAVVSNGSICQAFLAEEGCVKAGPGVRCIWSRGRCLTWESSMANGSLTPAPFCPPKAVTVDERCYRFSDCASCTANTNGCQWCDDKKCISASSNCTSNVKNFTECPVRNEQVCSKLANCKSCSLNLNCQWDQNQPECHALPGLNVSGVIHYSEHSIISQCR
ncbi:attractin-like protein 1 [Lates japonicus]|uniref:Attractin-like protein 1 n=1 Tax=Lates japonicus TaxID=270547 RepID=A0AAD3QXH3_LATJO|nr:attractin-like protein 1 [Lates japonicus]